MIADARDNDSGSAPFPSFADFLAAQSFLNQQGQEVRARRERIGALTATSQVTLTDILLGGSRDESFTISLRPDTYELHAIWGFANRVNELPFFLFLTSTRTVSQWQKFPQRYVSDASHLAFVPTARLAALRATLELDSRVWNAMCDLVCAFRDKEATIFAERGFSFGSPSGEAAPFLIAPMAGHKIATLYLGVDEHNQICALQARNW